MWLHVYEADVDGVKEIRSLKQFLAEEKGGCQCYEEGDLKAVLLRAKKASELGESGEQFLATEASSSANLSP